VSPADLHLGDETALRLIDRLLPGAEAAEAQAHLSGCGACRALVESHRALAAALDDLEAPEPPADFTEGVLTLIDSRERAAARERRLAAGILGAAALGAAALLAAAGTAAWAPVLSGIGDAFAGAATWSRLGADVAGPVVRALRLEIAMGAAGAAATLLLALRRLTPRHVQALA
jgi:anti-sigma factor RsiW